MSAADRLRLAVPKVAVAFALSALSSAAAVLSNLVVCAGCGAAAVNPGHSCRKSCSAAVGAATDAEGKLLLAADV